MATERETETEKKFEFTQVRFYYGERLDENDELTIVIYALGTNRKQYCAYDKYIGYDKFRLSNFKRKYIGNPKYLEECFMNAFNSKKLKYEIMDQKLLVKFKNNKRHKRNSQIMFEEGMLNQNILKYMSDADREKYSEPFVWRAEFKEDTRRCLEKINALNEKIDRLQQECKELRLIC